MSKLTLNKAQKLTLTKASGGVLTKVRAEMKWSTPEHTVVGGRKFEYDLDASAFVLKADGKALDNTKHFCFFNQPETPAIVSSGDDLGGDDSGETLLIDLNEVPKDGVQIPIVITLHEAIKRNQALSHVTNGSLELFDDETGESLAYAELTSLADGDTSVLFVVLNRVGDVWEVENVNTGYKTNINDWVNLYGIDLDA